MSSTYPTMRQVHADVFHESRYGFIVGVHDYRGMIHVFAESKTGARTLLGSINKVWKEGNLRNPPTTLYQPDPRHATHGEQHETFEHPYDAAMYMMFYENEHDETLLTA